MPIRGSGHMTLDVKKKGEKPCTPPYYTTIVNCVCQPPTTRLPWYNLYAPQLHLIVFKVSLVLEGWKAQQICAIV